MTVLERFVAGGSAGAVAQAFVYPLEVSKTRLAVSAPGTYEGLAHCLRSVARAEGVGALYSGLGASIVGIVRMLASISASIHCSRKRPAGGMRRATRSRASRSFLAVEWPRQPAPCC